MKAHALNVDNDIFLGSDGSLALVQDGPEVVQHVRSRLLFFTGEWFLDLLAGTPYFESIFVKPADLGRVESILKTRILETPEVSTLTEFYMDFNEITRNLRINFTAETTYGTIDETEVFINV